jgi:hypothetical protein
VSTAAAPCVTDVAKNAIQQRYKAHPDSYQTPCVHPTLSVHSCLQPPL